MIFPDKDIKERLDVEIEMSDIMQQAIARWTNMYEDKALWLDGDRVRSLNIPSSVASEIARLVTIEMESEVTGTNGKDNDRSIYLNEQYQKVIDSLRIQTEYAAAKGGMIFKPYIDGDNIAVDYVQADNFYPVKFNSSGDLIAVIFPEVIVKNGKTYTRLEYHHLLEDNIYYVSNTSYVKDGEGNDLGGLGKPCELSSVEEWQDLEGELNIEDVEKPLFSYFKLPLANNKDSRSHLGVSIYAKAENLIEEVDRMYSSILWEYKSKETAIDVSPDMLLNMELAEGEDRIFRKLDTDDESFYEPYSPNIRDSSYFNGLNRLLQRVEYNCGLAYGTLSDMDIVEKTATEINSSKQRSYSTVSDIQKALRVALEHLLYAMDFYTTMYNKAPTGEYEASFHFDDSIVINSKEEQAITLQEVAAGLIKPEYYLQKRYGLTEEQALEMLPNLDTGIDKYDDLE